VDTPTPEITQKPFNWATLTFVALFVLVLFNILFILRLNRLEKNDPMKDYLESELKKSEARFNKAQSKIDSLNNLNIQSQVRIKELEIQKDKVHYVYIQKTKEIDNLNVNGIIHEFNGIFPKQLTSKGNR
jgi:hypothetical protein